MANRYQHMTYVQYAMLVSKLSVKIIIVEIDHLSGDYETFRLWEVVSDEDIEAIEGHYKNSKTLKK